MHFHLQAIENAFLQYLVLCVLAYKVGAEFKKAHQNKKPGRFLRLCHQRKKVSLPPDG